MKKTVMVLMLIQSAMYVNAQSTSFDYCTTLPILYLNPDSRLGGFGEIGTVASSIYDNTGLTQNPALLSRNNKMAGITTNVSAFSKYDRGAYLGNIGLFYSIDSNNTLGYTFDYFRTGSVLFENNDSRISRPYEYYHSLRYAHTFLKKFSAGIGIKLIKSDLAPKIKSGFYTFSVDLGIDYRRQFPLSAKSGFKLDVGAAAKDIGPKIRFSKSSSQHSDNIPIDVAVGTMLTFSTRIGEKSSFNFDLAYQIESIVVPTPKIFSATSEGWLDELQKGSSSGLTPVEGYFGSFALRSDSNEMKAFTFAHKFGAEAKLNIKGTFIFALRGGYIQEFESEGAGKYFTFGAGIGLYGFRFDYSQLIAPKSTGAFGLSYSINLSDKKSRFEEN